MKPKNAQLLLEMLGTFTVNQIRQWGALEALTELHEIIKQAKQVYISVPMTASEPTLVSSTDKISGIKALRSMFDLGLKEAKDMFEAYVFKSVVNRNTNELKLGPFPYHGDTEVLQKRVGNYPNSGSTRLIIE